jgi:DNA-binding MarR family transcriptional regulator
MVDSAVKLLLEQTIDTPCKLHLLLIFNENPRLVASPRQLAERSCRDIWSVTQALQELSESGVLSSGGSGGERTYRYTPRPDQIEAIRQLVRGYDDPFQRDWIQSSVRELESYAAYNRRFAHQSFAF